MKLQQDFEEFCFHKKTKLSTIQDYLVEYGGTCIVWNGKSALGIKPTLLL